MTQVSKVWRRAIVGELCWDTASGPQARGVVPLCLDGRPTLALPYSYYADVAGLHGKPVTFSVTKSAGGDAGAMTGRVRIVHDLDGEVFLRELLTQEIVKFPPTRLLADGLMAQRDNWWWVARMLVTLEVEDSHALPVREDTNDALLVREFGGGSAEPGTTCGPRVSVARIAQWPVSGAISVPGASADGATPAATERSEDASTRALLFGHARSPDAERWESWSRTGVLQAGQFHVTEAHGQPSTVGPMSLLQRYRTHRARAKDCRRGLAQAKRDAVPQST